jgi:hypothetical protein
MDRSTSARGAKLPLAAMMLGVALFAAGCTSPEEKRGDELLRAGDFEGAASAYREALARDPNDRRLMDALEATERRAASVRLERGLERLAKGDLEGAVLDLEVAVRFDPANDAARAALERARPHRDAVRQAISLARDLLLAGDPLGAVRALAPHAGLREGSPELGKTYERARKEAAAFLRDRAARRLSEGRIAEANDDLAEARRLEASAGGAENAVAREPNATEPRPAGTPGAMVGLAALDAYGKAAAEVKQLTADLPRIRRKGLPEPEDYALPETEIPKLRAAIERAVSAKPPTERQPQWLAHGRLVLEMSIETAIGRRLAAAEAALAAGAAVSALREVEAARTIDRDARLRPRFLETEKKIRAAVARALLDAAARAEAQGLYRLARLRARQAAEFDSAIAAEATEAAARTGKKGAEPAVALLPFVNYTASTGLETRLYARLFDRIGAEARASVLFFDAYRKSKEAGALPPISAIVRGEIVRAEIGEAQRAEEALAAEIEALRQNLDEARRRLAEAREEGGRAAARAEVEEADRRLARKERERASFLLASGGNAGGARAENRRLSGTIEVRIHLFDPGAGRDVSSERILRTAEGRTLDGAKAVEDALLDQASEAVIAAILARLESTPPAAKSPLDPRAALDARIAEVERNPAAAERGTLDALLEATGYSFEEKRTIPARLKID